MRRLLLLTLLTTLAPCVNAQHMVSASPRFAPGHNRSGHPHAFFYPVAFSDPFYSDYLSSTGYPAASQPPVVILQAPPAESVPERSSPPAQPLMIELQGDRYVRVSAEETSGAELIHPMPESATPSRSPSGALIRTVPAPALPPAVLVFRDGHREDVNDYTITSGVLYARADYYTSGSWNKRIELSSLNLPETVSSNHSRGIRFQLPSAPNEVIVGP